MAGHGDGLVVEGLWRKGTKNQVWLLSYWLKQLGGWLHYVFAIL